MKKLTYLARKIKMKLSTYLIEELKKIAENKNVDVTDCKKKDDYINALKEVM